MCRAQLLLAVGVVLLFVPTAPAGAEDEPLPPGAIARLGTQRFYHGCEIGALAVSPDGKVLASGDKLPPSRDQESLIILWRASQGTRLHEIKTPDNPIHNLTFSPDGTILAASFGQNCVGLWDARTGQPWETKHPLPRPVRQVAFDAAGRLLMCDVEGEWTALDLDTGKIVKRWNPWPGGRRPLLPSGLPAEDCTFSQFSPDCQRLLFGCTRYEEAPEKKGKREFERHYVRLVNAGTNKTIAELEAKADDMCRAGFSPDGKRLFTGGRRLLQIWDVATGRKVRELLPEKYGGPYRKEDAVTALAVSAEAVAAVQDDLGLRVWDHKSGRLLLELPAFVRLFNSAQPPLLFTPDGKTLLVGLGGVVRCWDVNTRTDQFLQPGHYEPVLDLQFSADGRILKSISESLTYLWDAKWRPLPRLKEDLLRFAKRDILKSFSQHGYPGDLAKSSDGLFCVEYMEDGFYLCKTSTGEVIRKLTKWERNSDDRYSSFSPDNRQVLLCSLQPNGSTTQLALYDVASGKLLWQQKIKNLCHGNFSPDGKWLVCQAHAFRADGAKALFEWQGLYVLDAATGQILRVMKPPAEGVANGRAPFSPDMRLFALTFYHGAAETAVIYRIDTLKEVGRVTSRCNKELEERGDRDHSYLIREMALSPDGRSLATTHAGQATVRLWEVASGLERGRFDGHTTDVTSVAFAPDGHTLVSGHENGTILVWSLDGPISQTKSKRPPTRQEAALLWDTLASPGGPRVDDAIWGLVRAPDLALPLLRDKVSPVQGPSAEKVARWIAELDHDDFDKREAASRELETLLELVEPALRTALKQEPSLEKRKRLERLLELEGKTTAPPLRQLRALEVLEHIGSPEARKLLATLADGAPEARLTREAKAALRRLQP